MQELPPVELPGASRPAMAWDAWGVADQRRPLTAKTRSVLQAALGISSGRAHHGSTQPALTRSSLSLERRRALGSIVGPGHVSSEDSVRVHHLGGKSTLDLLARRSNDPQPAPDAVVFPANADEVEAVLRYCSDESIAVVPFGGGTSVVGGVDPVREWFDTVVTVSTRRMNALTDLDEGSRTATLEAGVSGPEAERMLARHGFSLGHFPQSFAFASIGGFAATRSSGQASAGYGRFDQMVEALSIATPVGAITCGHVPASAAGPDLRQVFLGSEGTLGIITSVTVRVHPVPEYTEYRAWWFSNFTSGVSALRVLSAHTAKPTVLRLSDETETGINSLLSDSDSNGEGAAVRGGCVAIALFEGSRTDVQARASAADAVVCASGGEVHPNEAARVWERGRFDAPYLRDALLDAGALAETLETAARWSTLARVRSEVTDALVGTLTESGTPPVVMCHISHVYPTGASLYFTVVCAAGDDPSAQWRAAKDAATQAMIDTHATITHHHAVGRDHLPYMTAEVGPIGTSILRAIKSAVDPAGVLNPGKLIP